MSRLEVATQFVESARRAVSAPELAYLLESATRELGFHYFALVHSLDFRTVRAPAFQLHNYPESWVDRFTQDGLHAEDPVHQACLRSNVGFAWTELPTLIPLTNRQRAILVAASRHGLRFGFTAPANLAGEYGACSFASGQEPRLTDETLMIAQLVGGFAFQAARRLQDLDRTALRPKPRLTGRQRECLLLAIRGKTDWEIGKILSLSEETVSRHLDTARARYGVTKRIQLAAHAIFDGEISLIEVLIGQVPLKRE